MHDQLRREKGRGVGYRRHRRIVGGDIDQSPVAGARQIGEQQRQKAIGNAGKRMRALARKDGGDGIGHGLAI